VFFFLGFNAFSLSRAPSRKKNEKKLRAVAGVTSAIDQLTLEII